MIERDSLIMGKEYEKRNDKDIEHLSKYVRNDAYFGKQSYLK